MSVVFPSSASITLRLVTGSALSYDQMDTNWSNLQVTDQNIIDVIEGAAYTGSTNVFTEDNTFLGNVGITGSLQANWGVFNGQVVSNYPGVGFVGTASYALAVLGGGGGGVGTLQQVTTTGNTTNIGIDVIGGADITINGLGVSSSIADLYANGGGTPSLQDVTTTGNQTSQSINVTSSFTAGKMVLATKMGAVAFGSSSLADAVGSHAEGSGSTANGDYAHAEGFSTTAYGFAAHAEGRKTQALMDYAHAEGSSTRALNLQSHAEGGNTTAAGESSHAEGTNTIAEGNDSHAEGAYTWTLGIGSHAEGFYTYAEGDYSHAEGANSSAIGIGSHAAGSGSVAGADYQTVVGYKNAIDTSLFNTAGYKPFIVGAGAIGGPGANLMEAYVVQGSIGITPARGTIVLPSVSSSFNYANDAAASAGGIPIGGLYRNGNVVSIRVT